MGTKRVLIAVVTALIVVVGVFLTVPKKSGPGVLRLCTWSSYFPEASIAEFTKKTGIPVEMSFISSNEELFAKLRAGATGFDVIQPSDYMIRQMTKLNMILPLDHAKLPNLVNIDEYYTNRSYDPGLKVSVPFTWGTTGIAVNTAKVKVPAGGIGWDFLIHSSDPKRTSLLDDMREVFSGVLLARGKGMNTLNQVDLEFAKAHIAALKSRILMFTSEPRPLLLREELTVAHAYSVDAIQANAEKPEIQYFIPKEGAVIWTDNFSIPTSAKHVDEAHTFINYFLDADNALAIITSNHLATPNKEAKKRLPAEARDNTSMYPPPEVFSRLHFLEDMGDTLTIMNRMWTELKS